MPPRKAAGAFPGPWKSRPRGTPPPHLRTPPPVDSETFQSAVSAATAEIAAMPTANAASPPREVRHVKPIACFRPGRHTAMSGVTLDFTAAQVAAIAAAYDPAVYEAPLVVGHPTIEAPAFGWVERLQAPEGELHAFPRQVAPEFADAVNAGRYKHVSISLWGPDAPGNPKPGGYYLRHVGFLGAAAPAVKGLPPVQFAEDETGVETLEYSAPPGAWSIARIARALREWLISDKGLATADQVAPDYLVRDLEEAANRPEPEEDAAPAPMFSAPPEEVTVTEQEAAQLRAENDRLKAEAKAVADAQAAAVAAARRAGIVAYVDGLAAEGRSLLTRRKAAVVELLAALPADQQLSFAEGDATATIGSESLAREILAALPKDVPLKEVAGREAAAGAVQFAAPPGYAVDAEEMELHAKALAHMATHPNVDYLAAVAAAKGA